MVMTVSLFTLNGIAQAAVTEVSIAKGHHLYDVREKLYRSSRVATGHNPSAATIDAPTEEDKARLDAGNFSSAGGGYYKFDLYAHATASDGDYTVQFYDNTLKKSGQDKKTLPVTLVVHVKDIVVVTVSFLGGATPGLGIKIAKDPYDTVVTEPEWWNGAKNDPGAYVRNTGAKQVKVKLNGPANETYVVDATGDWGGIEDKEIAFDGNGVYVSNSFEMGNAVPTVVGDSNVGWQWRVTKSGETTNINSSSHEIYVVYADNSSFQNKYRELYEFGCNWASGNSSESAVYGELWSHIVSLTATNYFYYYPDLPPVTWSNDSHSLILHGNGRCGAWMRLYHDLVGVQGIAVNKRGVAPDSPRTALRVYASKKGQGNVTPVARSFTDHAIDRYDNEYYDPSYGTGPYSTLKAWEDASIEEYWDQGWVADDKGAQEVHDAETD
jgi:hypothetical protein